MNRATDIYLLAELEAIDVADEPEGDDPDDEYIGGRESLSQGEAEAFSDMRRKLNTERNELSAKQRAWVLRVCERVGVNPVRPDDRKPVPRGNEVELAPVLRSLPLKPPTRRAQ